MALQRTLRGKVRSGKVEDPGSHGSGGDSGKGSDLASSTMLQLYAEYERARGGLLWVLQATVIIAQVFVARYVVRGEWWSPIRYLPLYVAYFPVSQVLRYRLYRQAGRVESEKALREARRSVSRMALTAVLTITVVWFVSPATPTVPVWFGIGWTLALWGVLLVAGRLPADFPLFLYVWFMTTDALRDTHRFDTVAWLFAAFMIVVGVVEHIRYGQAFARKADTR